MEIILNCILLGNVMTISDSFTVNLEQIKNKGGKFEARHDINL
jgi:hypothetical protein